MKRIGLWTLVACAASAVAVPGGVVAGGEDQRPRQVPSHAASNGRARGDLLLRDFRPRAMLKVPVHEVERAAFPAVDVHNHVNDARGGGRPVPLPDLLARMDRLNVKRIVILTGGWGGTLQGVVDRMVKPHPDRFTVFTQATSS